MPLYAPERLVLMVAGAVCAFDVALIVLRGSSVDVTAYAMLLALFGALLTTGAVYRRTGRSEGIGAAAIGAAIFVLFTSAASLLNYLLTPNANPTIDLWLIQLDASLGFRWPDGIAWAARHPLLNEMMRVAYLSTLIQIAALVVTLGMMRKLADLHSLMLTVALSGLVTIVFWGFFPTTGPTYHYALPDELMAQVRPVLGLDYGPYVAALLHDGAPFLSPDDFRGLVAFPSFHTVLACAATYYTRTIRWLFPPVLALNVLVIPAVVIHGGHHLVDIPGGVAVFLLALLCSGVLMRAGRERVQAMA